MGENEKQENESTAQDVINQKWYQLLVIMMACTSMISMGQAVAMPGYLLPQLMLEHEHNVHEHIHISKEKGAWIGMLN